MDERYPLEKFQHTLGNQSPKDWRRILEVWRNPKTFLFEILEKKLGEEDWRDFGDFSEWEGMGIFLRLNVVIWIYSSKTMYHRYRKDSKILKSHWFKTTRGLNDLSYGL